jgi:hypothetical protein
LVLVARRAGLVLLFLCWLLIGGISFAQEGGGNQKTSSLSWLRMPGADSCVATQPLARAVEERLGRSVFVSAAQADLSVEGRIEKKKNGTWHATIIVRDAKGATLGTRDVDRKDASCDAMTEPLALIIAVMIDPDAAMRPKTDPTPPTTATTTPTATASAEPTATTAPTATTTAPTASERPDVIPPPKPDPWRFEGHGHITINHGIAPVLDPGAGVQAILYPPKIPVGFRGYTALFLPTTREMEGARASFDMLYAGGSICPTLRGRVNLLGCIGGQLGILRPRAETPNRGIDESIRVIWNVMLEARIHIPIIAPIGVAAGVGAGLPLVRPTVEYRGGTTNAINTLHKSEAYVLTADVGLGLYFP